MIDRVAYLRRAEALERETLELGVGEPLAESAIARLLELAGGDLAILRRAHRHLEQRLRDQWPATDALVRAFHLISTARRRMEGIEVEKGSSR